VILTVVFLFVTVVATLNVAELAPAGTVTVAGTAAFAGFLLLKVTPKPPIGAAEPSVTVPSEFEPSTIVDGFTATDESAAGGAGFTVIVVDFVTPA